MPRRARTRNLSRLPLALLFGSLLLAPASGQARQATGSDPLSPLLSELARPAVRSAPVSQQAHLLGLPDEGPVSLQRQGRRVLVSVRFDAGALRRLPALRSAGAAVADASSRYQTVTASVLPADLHALAAVPGVAAVTPVRQPLLFQPSTSVVGEPPCEGGAVVSEGLQQLAVDSAREAFGLRGEGVTVGVLSDSFDQATEAVSGGSVATHAAEDVQSNDLPGPAGTCSGQQLPVHVIQEGPAGESADEGRAMLQIVHDLAPHSPLAFATAFSGESGFAKNIEKLARPIAEGGAGAKVIVDDVAYLEEPFFQDGPVAAAIKNVVGAGVTYLSAAGNDNLFDSEGHEIASWEAPAFRDAGTCPPPLGPTETTCMDFDPGVGVDDAFGITVEPESTLTLALQWAEPWNGVQSDLDAFLFSEDESELLTASADDNTASQKPVELIGWENQESSPREVKLVIDRCFAACNPGASVLTKPRLKFILMENGGGVEAVEYPVSSEGDVVGPSIFGHAGSAAALSVGAIPFTTNSQPEPYSSRGPVTHYFGPVTGTSAAPELASPEEVAKPDFVATDCGATTFFATFFSGAWRFCGTSAAAPHAAAVAALLKQGVPGAGPAQIGDALAASAVPVDAFAPQAVGSGLVEAEGAISTLGIAPTGEDGPSTTVPPLGGASVISAPVQQEPPPPAAPATLLAKHPPHRVRTRGQAVRLAFAFASDQAGVTFLCKADRARYRACPRRFVHRFGLGRHVLKVKARNAQGLVDPTPAVFRFTVKSR